MTIRLRPRALPRRTVLAGLAAAALPVPALAAQALPMFLKPWLATRETRPGSWTYEDGVVWKGALDLYTATGDAAFFEYILGAMDSRVLNDGALPGFNPTEFNLDSINSGKILFPLYSLTGEPRFRKAMDVQFRQLPGHPRTHSGNYWHKKIYPWQVWLDGVYMAQPFQTAYARITGNKALFADTVRQIKTVHAVMRRSDGLYYHGWDESRTERWSDPKTGLSPNIWGRAMGWWAAALIDVYEASEGMDKSARAEIACILQDTLTAVVAVRSKRGLWYQVMDQGNRDGNYEEASATLMFAYTLMKSARLGIASRDFKAIGQNSLQSAIDTFVTPDGLDGTCAVAGLGGRNYRDGSYAYYIGEKTRLNDPKGVGALMWALAEGLRA